MAGPAAGLYVELRALVAKFQQDMDGAVKTVLGAEKRITGVFKTLEKVTQAAMVIGGVVAVKKLGDALSGLAQKGEVAESIAQQFQKLGGNQSEIAKARDNVLGMVDSFDLMKIANEGLLKQIPGFNQNFSKIADLGARLADTLGTETGPEIERVANALASAKEKQLAAIGVTIDADKAYQNYAKQIGVTADVLTVAQKTEARQIEAIQHLDEALARLGPVTDSVANAHEAFGVALGEALKEMGIAINANETLRVAWRNLEETIKKIDWRAVGEDVGFLASKIVDALGWGVEQGTELLDEFARSIKVVQELAAQPLSSKSLSAAQQTVAMAESLDQQAAAANKAEEAMGRLNKVTVFQGDQFVLTQQGLAEASKAVKMLEDAVAAGGPAADLYGEKLKGLQQDVKNYGVLLKDSGDIAIKHGEKGSKALEKEAKAAKKAADAAQKLSDKLVSLVAADKVDALKDQIRSALEAGNIQGAQNFLEEYTRAVEAAAQIEVAEFAKVNPQLAEEHKRAIIEKAIRPEAAEIQKAFAEAYKKSAEELQKAITQFFSGITQIASVVEDTFGVKLPDGMKRALDIANGIVSAFQGVLDVVDSVSTVMDQLAQDDSSLNMILDVIGSFFGVDAGGIGGILEDILGGIGDIFGGIFAKGGVFDGAKIEKAAHGMIVSTPTMFHHAKGIGLMGEAGPEAIMPLTRIGGKLGVMSTGDGGRGGLVVNVYAPGAAPGAEIEIRRAIEDMAQQTIEQAVYQTVEAYRRGHAQ